MANNIVTIQAKREYAESKLDPVNDTLKVALITSAGDDLADNTKKQWTSFSADIQTSGYEVAGSGYTTGGYVLSGVAITATGTPTGNRQYYDADDVIINGTTLSASGCVIYKSADGGGGGSVDLPIEYLSFNENKSVSNGTFTISWNSNYGFLSLI